MRPMVNLPIQLRPCLLVLLVFMLKVFLLVGPGIPERVGMGPQVVAMFLQDEIMRMKGN